MQGTSLCHMKHHTMSPFVARCQAFHYVTRSITQCHRLSQDVMHFITSHEASHNVTICHKMSGFSLRHAKHHTMSLFVTRCRAFITSHEASHNATVCHNMPNIITVWQASRYHVTSYGVTQGVTQHHIAPHFIIVLWKSITFCFKSSIVEPRHYKRHHIKSIRHHSIVSDVRHCWRES